MSTQQTFQRFGGLRDWYTVKSPNRVVLLPNHERVTKTNFVFEYSEFRRGTVPSSSFNFTLSRRNARRSKRYSTYVGSYILQYYTTIRLNATKRGRTGLLLFLQFIFYYYNMHVLTSIFGIFMFSNFTGPWQTEMNTYLHKYQIFKGNGTKKKYIYNI